MLNKLNLFLIIIKIFTISALALEPTKADVPPVGNWRSCLIVAETLIWIRTFFFFGGGGGIQDVTQESRGQHLKNIWVLLV